MEDLIEQYLFKYKNCPLPSVGTLQIKESNAVAWHGDNKLSAPGPHIEFSTTETPADHFVAFIATQKNIPVGEASVSLQKYCIGLQKLNSFGEIKLENAGKFFIDHTGILVFQEDPLPKEFLPSIRFDRVPFTKAASHSIRVGDTETTSEVMTEYYSEKEKVKKGNWWIAAVILTVVAGAALAFYYKEHSRRDVGNTQTFTAPSAQQTYQTN